MNIFSKILILCFLITMLDFGLLSKLDGGYQLGLMNYTSKIIDTNTYELQGNVTSAIPKSAVGNEGDIGSGILRITDALEVTMQFFIIVFNFFTLPLGITKQIVLMSGLGNNIIVYLIGLPLQFMYLLSMVLAIRGVGDG